MSWLTAVAPNPRGRPHISPLTRPGQRKTPVRELVVPESPDLVFFSSAPENTRRFVERLDRPAVRIPLRPLTGSAAPETSA